MREGIVCPMTVFWWGMPYIVATAQERRVSSVPQMTYQ